MLQPSQQTRHIDPCVGSMLGQGRRRWANIEATQGQGPVLGSAHRNVASQHYKTYKHSGTESNSTYCIGY